ncbi:hypothetical protein ABBQ38_014488 [Trebouxia sp. C0009 RCD-2024]
MGFYEAVEAGVPAPARPEDHVAIVLLCDPADGIAFEFSGRAPKLGRNWHCQTFGVLRNAAFVLVPHGLTSSAQHIL